MPESEETKSQNKKALKAIKAITLGATLIGTLVALPVAIKNLYQEVQNTSHSTNTKPTLEQLNSQLNPQQLLTVAYLKDAKPTGQIISPKQNTVVPVSVDVKYKANNAAKQDNVILLVVDPLGQYWSWGKSTSGTFFQVQIGQSDSTSKGKEFKLILALSKDGIQTGNLGRQEPTNITVLNTISIIRK